MSDVPVVTPLSSYPYGKHLIVFVPAGDWKKGDLFQLANGNLYKITDISNSSGFTDGRLRLTTKQIKLRFA